MAIFGVDSANFCVQGGKAFCSPGEIAVEGDWSNGAFFLAAAALGSDVQVLELSDTSTQPDRTVQGLLPQLCKENMEICAADIPDLVPILAVVAAANQGATFTGTRRLRLKESDRVESTIGVIRQLGGYAEATEDRLTVYPGSFRGGIVDACNDHRIAMATAIAATVCTEPVTILGAEAVDKSYPGFWEEYQRLGGHYEKHLR